MSRLISCLFLCFLLSACGTVRDFASSFQGEDNLIPPRALTKFPQTLVVKKLWSKDIGDGSDKKYLKLTPAFFSDKLFIAENGGKLLALNNNSGSKVWNIKTRKALSGGPAIDDDFVVVGSQDGEVIAYNAETAEQLWIAQVSSEILSRPAIDGSIVVVRTIDNKLFGLEKSSGRRLWVYDHKVPSLTLRGTSNPKIDSGLVFSGFDGGKVVALELSTGKLIWESRIARATGSNELDRMVDIDSELIIDADTIFVTTFQGNVAAVDVNSGQIIWLREISSFAGLAVSDDYVFVSDEDSVLWALDRFSGDSVWKQEKLFARSITAPALHDEYVVVGDLEGYLHWFNSETGEIVARTQVNDSKIISTPMIENNNLYAYVTDGTMAAYTIGENRQLSDNRDIEEQFEAEKRAQLANKDISDNYENDTESEGFSFNQLFNIFRSDDEETEEASDSN